MCRVSDQLLICVRLSPRRAPGAPQQRCRSVRACGGDDGGSKRRQQRIGSSASAARFNFSAAPHARLLPPWPRHGRANFDIYIVQLLSFPHVAGYGPMALHTARDRPSSALLPNCFLHAQQQQVNQPRAGSRTCQSKRRDAPLYDCEVAEFTYVFEGGPGLLSMCVATAGGCSLFLCCCSACLLLLLPSANLVFAAAAPSGEARGTLLISWPAPSAPSSITCPSIGASTS